MSKLSKSTSFISSRRKSRQTSVWRIDFNNSHHSRPGRQLMKTFTKLSLPLQTKHAKNNLAWTTGCCCYATGLVMYLLANCCVFCLYRLQQCCI